MRDSSNISIATDNQLPPKQNFKDFYEKGIQKFIKNYININFINYVNTNLLGYIYMVQILLKLN